MTVIGSGLNLRLVEMAIGKVFADENCSFFNAIPHSPLSIFHFPTKCQNFQRKVD